MYGQAPASGIADVASQFAVIDGLAFAIRLLEFARQHVQTYGKFLKE